MFLKRGKIIVSIKTIELLRIPESEITGYNRGFARAGENVFNKTFSLNL